MYQGKFTNSAASGSTPRRKPRLSWRKEFVLACSAIVLLIGFAGGSLAYLFTHTDSITNTFTPAEVDVTIQEKFDHQKKKENVKFKNKGDVPVYMRARLVINWTDAHGNIVPAVPEGYSYTTSGDLPGTGWVERNDGYYYYTSPVAAGESTTNLVDSITATTPKDPEYYLLVDVLVETIQATPTDAVTAAWGFDPTTLGGNA